MECPNFRTRSGGISCQQNKFPQINISNSCDKETRKYFTLGFKMIIATFIIISVGIIIIIVVL